MTKPPASGRAKPVNRFPGSKGSGVRGGGNARPSARRLYEAASRASGRIPDVPPRALLTLEALAQDAAAQVPVLLEPLETPDSGASYDAVAPSTPQNSPRTTPAARVTVHRPRARDDSEDLLARLGHETAAVTAARWRREGFDEEAHQLEKWAAFDVRRALLFAALLGKTRTGKPRGMRLSLCGVAFVAKADGVIGWERRPCRDRHCPPCGEAKARGMAGAMRAWIRERDAMSRCCFPTLTKPKFEDETPREAVDSILADWRRFSRSKWFQDNVAGGVRSVEATAREQGDQVGDYVVRVSGIHAHIHAILEFRRPANTLVPDGATVEEAEFCNVAALCHYARLRDELPDEWVRYTRGSVKACKVVQLTDENIYQVSNYPLNLSGLVTLCDIAPRYVERVIEALRSRHLVYSFGEWRGKLTTKQPGTLRFGDRSVSTLLSTHPEDQKDVEWCGGGSDEASDVYDGVVACNKPLRQPEPLSEERAQVRALARERRERAIKAIDRAGRRSQR